MAETKAPEQAKPRKKITIPYLAEKKARREPITMLAGYDYPTSIVRAGIPVMGHIGITPMRVAQLGGFSAQGKTAERAQELIDDARAMVDAGCFSILCEVTTSEVCEYLAETLPVPVISLGAGNKG